MSSRNPGPWLIAIAIGAAGGIAHYLDDVANHGRRFARAAFAMAVMIAAFFGWLGGEAARAFGHPELEFVAAGIGGYLGPQSLDLALNILRRRAGLDDRKPKP
jgi:hypothetical protein